MICQYGCYLLLKAGQQEPTLHHTRFRFHAMSDFLRLAAYAFLALMSVSAWNTYSGGWRYYFGIFLFIICIMRIVIIVRQRMTASRSARPRGPAAAHTPDKPPLPGTACRNQTKPQSD